MDSMKLCCVLVLLVVGLARLPALVWGGNGVRRCDFPVIYNFGDSNSDTGGISSAALKEVPTRLHPMVKPSLVTLQEGFVMADSS